MGHVNDQLSMSKESVLTTSPSSTASYSKSAKTWHSPSCTPSPSSSGSSTPHLNQSSSSLSPTSTKHVRNESDGSSFPKMIKFIESLSSQNAESLLQVYKSSDTELSQMMSGACVYFLVQPGESTLTVAELLSRLEEVGTIDEFKSWANHAAPLQDDQATQLRCKLYTTKAKSAMVMNWAMGFSMAWTQISANNLANSLKQTTFK